MKIIRGRIINVYNFEGIYSKVEERVVTENKSMMMAIKVEE